MEENLVLQGNYLEDFNCLKNQCRSKCYLYRELFLTRDQYKAYKKIGIEGIDLASILKPLGKNRTDNRYAKLDFNKSSPIGLKDYMNIINMELGYDYLPDFYKYSPYT